MGFNARLWSIYGTLLPTAKPVTRAYTRYAQEAAQLLGLAIRNTRIESGATLAEVAERAGVSRGLLRRIEGGEMGTSLGAAFEVAAIVGVPLFDAEPTAFTRHLDSQRDKSTLLPQSVRARTIKVKDDF